MGETRIGGQLWSTYWSKDGKHQSGANFYTEQERDQDALRILRQGWKVAFGDHANLQDKLVERVAEHGGSQPVDRPADLNDPLWVSYWLWFASQEPELHKDMGEPRQAGSVNLARQEDFNCWKDHRQGILDAWNAWKHSHSYSGQLELAAVRGNFIATLPERDQEFLQELSGLLDV